MRRNSPILKPFLLGIFLLSSSLICKKELKAQYLDIGATMGGTYYLGDINPNLHFVGTQFAYGGFIRINYRQRWGFRLGFNTGKLSADDKDFLQVNAIQASLGDDFDINDPNLIYYSKVNRGLNFETNITEVNFITELNFFPFFVGSKKNKWTPYIFAGLALALYNPKPIGEDTYLRDLGTEGQGLPDRNQIYGNSTFAFPFGIGIKFSIAQKLGLGFEWGMRKLYSDYLDDISSTYYLDLYGFNPEEGIYYAPNPDNPIEIISFPITDDVLYSDPTFSHKKGDKRGNQYNNDWYSFFGITITYKLNLLRDDGCRDFSRSSYF